MEKKQTTVEQLQKLFYTYAESTGIDNDQWVIKEEDLDKLFEQAKEMEKEQILKAYEKGYDDVNVYEPEKYYNETYKSQ